MKIANKRKVGTYNFVNQNLCKKIIKILDELNNKQYISQVSNCYVITDPALNCKYIRSISDNPNGKN